MGFMRPKSRGPPDDTEAPRRNRLSKPQTKKSQTSLRNVAKQEMASQDSRPNNDSPQSEDVLRPVSRKSSRAEIQTESLGMNSELTALPPLPTATSRMAGVAQLVARFETAQPAPSTSQLSLLGATQPKRPLSGMLNSWSTSKIETRRSYIDTSSEQRASLQTKQIYRGSPTESIDEVPDPDAIPSRRKSKYNPGEATRRPSAPEIVVPVIARKPVGKLPEDDSFSFVATEQETISEVGMSSTRAARSGSPTGLERTSLGNLGLGSLHVVNGRASPAFSDRSKAPKSHNPVAVVRDVSSVYADSEAWEDDTVPDEHDTVAFDSRLTAEYDKQRAYSYEKGEQDLLPTYAQYDQHIHGEVQSPSAIDVKPPRTSTSRPRRNTSTVAREYMAELPASPYADLQSSRSLSPVESTGSVVRHQLSDHGDDNDDDNDDDYMSFQNDHTMSPSHETQRVVSVESQNSSIVSKISTVESKLSSLNSQFAQEDVFQSALEFPPPRSPERPRPALLKEQTNLPDSGYSSNNSARSMSIDEPRPDESHLQTIVEQPKETPQKENGPRKLGGFLPLRPALKSYATAPVAPVARHVQPEKPVHQSLTSFSVQPEASPSKVSKLQKKLQKARPHSFITTPKPPKEIVVQRMSSQLFDIPAIPPLAVANLGLRAQVIPELEHTVRHSSGKASTASLRPTAEIRFPSPNPEPEEDERQTRRSKSRSRSRSKSKRRSFLAIFTGDKDSDQHKVVEFQAPSNMTIKNLGDVVSTLGANPYDIALPSSKPRSPSPGVQQQQFGITPHNVSIRRPRPRSMMDDREASQLARHRSKSIHERDLWNERRASFTGKTSVLGKNVRASSTAEDAPPVPPLPQQQDLRRISWRLSPQSAVYTQVVTPYETDLSWTPEVSPEPEMAPSSPPPPPPHSPQPSFVDNDEEYFHHHIEEPAYPPPPPPSHSPRPMDVTPEEPVEEDLWAAQAQAWKARRQSAGEALRAKWSTNVEAYHDAYGQLDRRELIEDEQLYPEIPTRHEDHYYAGGTNDQPPRLLSSQTWGPGRQYDNHHQIQDNYWDVPRYDEPHGYEYNYDYNHGYGQEPSQLYSSQTVEPSQARPLPTARATSRPRSTHSRYSAASFTSLAEDLHPPDLERRSPAPEWSRYSGGLSYGYEGRDKGFTGSAGMRNVSGKAEGAWKGTDLRRSWGVDLGDVPVMGIAHRI